MRTSPAKSMSPRIAVFIAALLALPIGLVPHSASADVPIGIVNNKLTDFGKLGHVRVRAVAPMSNGQFVPLTGDGTPKQNPNRGVGDSPESCPNLACRLLGNNSPIVNPGSDGHTHYHAGESRILISNAAGFVKGDTILVGNSPNCNYPFQQLTCNAAFDEQSTAEVNSIVSSVPASGPFIADLAFALSNDHLEGERLTKLPTLYQGQTLRVDVPDTALTNGGAATVSVRAFLLLPGLDPSDEDNYFQLGCTGTSVACEKIVPASSTATSTFFIRNIESVVANVGRTFDWNTADDWYSVLVSAKNTAGGAIVADGFSRFKVNPVAFAADDCDGDSTLDDQVCIQSDPTSPGEPVGVFGRLMDNSSGAATDRNVEDVLVNVRLENPLGLTFDRQDHSCYDSNASASDPCGTRVPTRVGTDHGVWFVRFGFEGSHPKGIIETLITGTYTVTASLALLPEAAESSLFDVILDSDSDNSKGPLRRAFRFERPETVAGA